LGLWCPIGKHPFAGSMVIICTAALGTRKIRTDESLV